MSEALELAMQDFTPVRREDRHKPARVKAISTRLYIDKYQEHRAAYEFLQEMSDLHGEGTKAFVRAIIHWDEYLRGLGDDQPILPSFSAVPVADRDPEGRRKGIGVRLYIDKYQEHRRCAEILEEAKDLHGEGTKMIVRALNHYRDTVIRPLEEKARRSQHQLFETE